MADSSRVLITFQNRFILPADFEATHDAIKARGVTCWRDAMIRPGWKFAFGIVVAVTYLAAPSRTEAVPYYTATYVGTSQDLSNSGSNASMIVNRTTGEAFPFQVTWIDLYSQPASKPGVPGGDLPHPTHLHHATHCDEQLWSRPGHDRGLPEHRSRKQSVGRLHREAS